MLSSKDETTLVGRLHRLEFITYGHINKSFSMINQEFLVTNQDFDLR